ncbi:MAG: hypothetical protein ACI8PB_003757, partial [Desulforhopalus sp.]
VKLKKERTNWPGKSPAIYRKSCYLWLHFYMAFYIAVSLGR